MKLNRRYIALFILIAAASLPLYVTAQQNVGRVAVVDRAKKEVLVHNPRGIVYRMGETLSVKVGGKAVGLTVTFPMLNITKCVVASGYEGYWGKIEKGMAVYRGMVKSEYEKHTTDEKQITFDKTYGGSNSDGASSIQQTKDGGYIVAGETWSKGAGRVDAWVIKLDKNGNVK